ncbi:MAG TPA: efflux RND transporter periplasmic adaptor subunit [Blastocatellia bacterium]|jgi:RND family efflux transporter MFP subunit
MKARILLIFALLFGIWLSASCGKSEPESKEQARLIEGVKVDTIKLSDYDDQYEVAGTVSARTTSVLSSKVLGSVTAIHAREGDRVRAGQLLVEIDSRESRAQLQKAQAGVKEAQNGLSEIDQSLQAAQSSIAAAEANKALATSTYNRYRAMLEGKAVSPQEFDEVKAKYEIALTQAQSASKSLDVLAARRRQALARIEQARADLSGAQVYASHSRITSPINGVVTARHVDPGYTATPGVPLLTLEDVSRYQLEAAVEESLITRLRVGDKARVRIDALGGWEAEGSVSEIVPVSDPASRSYTVKIDLLAGDGQNGGQQWLRSGLYGKARFVTGQRQALAIPKKALLERGQLLGVYVVDQSGVARFRLIKTGKSSGEFVEVLSGITEGERIVADRIDAVSDGSRVQ